MWELFDATGASSTNLNSDGDTVVSWLSGDPTTLKNATVDVENAISEICATGGGCTTTAGVKSVNGTPTVLNGWSINIYTIPSGDSPTCPDNTGGLRFGAPAGIHHRPRIVFRPWVCTLSLVWRCQFALFWPAPCLQGLTAEFRLKRLRLRFAGTSIGDPLDEEPGKCQQTCADSN